MRFNRRIPRIERIKRIGRGQLAGLVLVLGSVACRQGDTDADSRIANGDDPLRALTLAAPSTRYTSTYWEARASVSDARWPMAVRYCDGQRPAASGARPNCAAVFAAQFEIAGRAPVSTYPRRSAAEMAGQIEGQP